MAKPKQAPLKVIYHAFICDDNCGEADGFFEIVKGKLECVASWFCNDAQWRGEYMSGLLEHAGATIETLPEEYQEEASLMVAKEYGLVGDDDGGEDDEEEEPEGEREEATLRYKKGTSDKVYTLTLFESDDDGTWHVEALYGRRGGNLRLETKCEGEHYAAAKKIYDKILREKSKKGYK